MKGYFGKDVVSFSELVHGANIITLPLFFKPYQTQAKLLMCEVEFVLNWLVTRVLGTATTDVKPGQPAGSRAGCYLGPGGMAGCRGYISA